MERDAGADSRLLTEMNGSELLRFVALDIKAKSKIERADGDPNLNKEYYLGIHHYYLRLCQRNPF